MNFLHRLIRTLILPSNAGPGDAAIIIGPDIPPGLITYYAGLGSTVIGALIFRAALPRTDYDWIALIEDPGGVSLGIGTQESGAYAEMMSVFTIGGVGMINLASQGKGMANVVAGGVLHTESGADLDLLGPIFIDNVSGPRSYMDAYSTAQGNVANGGGGEAAIPTASWDSHPTLTFGDNHVFRIDVSFQMVNGVAGAQNAIIRVRQGTASVTGTIVGQKLCFAPGTFTVIGGADLTNKIVMYAKNATGAPIVSDLSLTIQSTNSCGLAGFSGRPIQITVQDVGSITDHPGLAVNAASLLP